MPRNKKHKLYTKLTHKQGELIEKVNTGLDELRRHSKLGADEAEFFKYAYNALYLPRASVATSVDQVDQENLYQLASSIVDAYPDFLRESVYDGTEERRLTILKYALGGLLICGLIVFILYVSGVIGHGKDKDEKEDEIEGFGSSLHGY